mmetsp:Transcript_32072/g.55337  ORF Transcript_32072/g.55337 Transcript_32072/m.55337 type:complete len:94 (+) Transcript_32072:93-374(+)
MKPLVILALLATTLAVREQTRSTMTEDCPCDEKYQGDGYCDEACDFESCNYDNGDCCHGDCVNGCDGSKLGDGECNYECNYECCEYDRGDCYQ